MWRERTQLVLLLLLSALLEEERGGGNTGSEDDEETELRSRSVPGPIWGFILGSS